MYCLFRLYRSLVPAWNISTSCSVFCFLCKASASLVTCSMMVAISIALCKVSSFSRLYQKMILRSRKISSPTPNELFSPKKLTSCDCPLTLTEDKVLKKGQTKPCNDGSTIPSSKKRTRCLSKNNRDYVEDEVSTAKMILRSHKIPARFPKDLHTPERHSKCVNIEQTQSTGRIKRVQPRCLWNEFKNNTIQNSDNSMKDEDLQTPIKERSIRVHFQLDDSMSEDSSLVGNIPSPVISFFSSPCQNSVWCSPPNNASKSLPSECPYFGHVPEEESEELLKISTFNIKSSAVLFEKSKKGKDIPLKTRSAPASTLVLDPVYLKVHPDGIEFLESLCKVYEIFVYTTAKKAYAEKILDILDPRKKLIRHRLFQDQCVSVDGHYLKDLRVIQRDLAKTVALDTNPHNFPFQKTNRIPVKKWTGSKMDKELMSLLPVLKDLTLVDDVRVAISHHFQTEGTMDEED
uniref:Mitochondrial import inner membrane translocase subunit TIM50 n=1 Tax=Leptobrachium leishanense TaxID=445787 RepID=A0A8C5P8C7_9ANUR